MPRKYQNGKLEIRKDVQRPYYFIRVTVPKIKRDGTRGKVREPRMIGFVDAITRKDAMRARAALLEQVNAPRMLAHSNMLFGDLVGRFLESRVPQLGAAVQKRYPSQIKNHILPAFGAMKVSDVDAPAIEQWLTAKKAEGLAPWTCTGLKGVLSAIFAAAKRWKLWEGLNPCEGIKVKKGTVREKRKLTAAQTCAILAAVGDRERVIITILFGLGLRISEALGLKWADVDFDTGILQVRRRWYRGDLSEESENKSEAGTRNLIMADVIISELRRIYPGPHRRGEFIFADAAGELPPDDRDLLRECFRPYIKRLGLYYKGFGWHAFRRENITHRQQAGATPIEAMKAAGHATVTMTALYTLQDPERERQQVNAIFEQLLAAAPAGAPQ